MSENQASIKPTGKARGAGKTRLIPIRAEAAAPLRKPDWIRVRAAAPGSRFHEVKALLRE